MSDPINITTLSGKDSLVLGKTEKLEPKPRRISLNSNLTDNSLIVNYPNNIDPYHPFGNGFPWNPDNSNITEILQLKSKVRDLESKLNRLTYFDKLSNHRLSILQKYSERIVEFRSEEFLEHIKTKLDLTTPDGINFYGVIDKEIFFRTNRIENFYEMNTMNFNNNLQILEILIDSLYGTKGNKNE